MYTLYSFYFTFSFVLTLKWFYIISKGQPFSNVLQTKTFHLTVFPLGNKLSFSEKKNASLSTFYTLELLLTRGGEESKQNNQ